MFWIRIHIPNEDPDPEDIERAKTKEKTKPKGRKLTKKYKKQCNWYKICICNYFQ
jgi:hypothetical protein